MPNDKVETKIRQQQKIQSGNNFIFAVVDWSSVIASVLFVLGSILNWPGVPSQDSNLGEASFLIGSFFFLATDLGVICQDPESNPVNCTKNASSLASLWCLLSDTAFILSSILLLQEEHSEIGWNVFVLACSCIIVVSIVLVYALYSENAFTEEFRRNYQIYKLYILLGAFFNTIGSLLLIVSLLILNDRKDTGGNDQIGNWIFLFGTISYLMDTLVILRMSKKMALAEEKMQKYQ